MAGKTATVSENRPKTANKHQLLKNFYGKLLKFFRGEGGSIKIFPRGTYPPPSVYMYAEVQLYLYSIFLPVHLTVYRYDVVQYSLM